MAHAEFEQNLGGELARLGIVSAEDLQKAFDEEKTSDQDLVEIIISRGYGPKQDVLQCMADQLGMPFVDLSDYAAEEEAVSMMDRKSAHDYRVFPVFLIGTVLTLAMANPRDVTIIDQVQRSTGMVVEPALAAESDILAAIDRFYGPTSELDDSYDEVLQRIEEVEEAPEDIESEAEALREIAEETPVIKLVNLVLAQAVKDKASDIHINPEEKALRVRYRVDGILHDVLTPPKHLQKAITSRLKILASMDIAESRVPQDGRIQAKVDESVIDYRVSSLPTVHGENLVLRILDKSSIIIGMEDLGFSEECLKKLRAMLTSAYGIILVTGPTGSGKTTTLYSALNSINSHEKNIITVEDPVEYRLPLIRQTQVNVKAGLTFAAGLRSILRQDPDIIMVGEVRDSETARIAVESALTGHLVLTTLHTNDAPGAVSRLIEMGVEPFLVSSATMGVLAQRLVRRICPKCRVEYRPSNTLLRELGINSRGKELCFYKGEGCDNCRKTGYRGRQGLFEIMTMSDEIRELTLHRASTEQIKKRAIQDGMRTLRQDGLMKALKGLTTLEEVMRATNAD